MDIETLRMLFEKMCERLEVDSRLHQMSFRGAVGLEYPQGVMMVFVFDKRLIVCRFEARQEGICEHQEPLSADDCLEMMECLRDWEGGFADIFGEIEEDTTL